jgi:protein arginine N-methyltransferase 1
MNFIKTYLIAALSLIRKTLSSNKRLRNLLYEIRNRDEFSDLYEHEKMLADKTRVETYKKAIEKNISEGDIVLDLGTGTGILSFFAAKNKPKKVYAIDHSDFIDVAKEIAKKNNFENIEFIKATSRKFNPDVKFDVIIHEQMGDYLFNENMIFNLLDLKKRLLKPKGEILPGKFELYLEPVDLNDEFNVPFLWENKVHGIDFTFLEKHYETLEKFKPADYRQEWIEATAVKQFLCMPEPVLSFDLNTMNSEKEIPRAIEIEKQVIESGMFDGFCLYFKAIFDNEINLNTSPLSEYTHWGNCLFRIETRACSGGEKIRYKFSMPNLLDIRTWRVSVQRFR